MAESDISKMIQYDKIPITALNSSSRRMLSMAMNPDMPLPGRNGFVRNWEGMAELVNLPYATVKLLKSRDDPTSAVLEFWEERRGMGKPSFSELMSHLETLERYEVLDDIQPLLQRDALTHLSFEEEARRQYDATCPVQVREVTSDSDSKHQATLTVADYELQLKHPELAFEHARYDAYVSYAECDVMFVTTLIGVLEGEHNLKLFVKDRDMLPGVLEYEAEIKMLHERCERILLVLSDEFLINPRCEFQTMFAQALAVDNNLYARKVIPIIYKPCELPVGLKYIAKLDYTKLDVFGSFWKRLYSSISSPMYSDTRCGRVSPSGLPTISSCPSQNRQHLSSSQSNVMASMHPLPVVSIAAHGATYHGPASPASPLGGSLRNSLRGSTDTIRSHLLNEPGPLTQSLSLSNSSPCISMEVQGEEDNEVELRKLSLTVDSSSARSRLKRDPPATKRKKGFFFQKRNPDPET